VTSVQVSETPLGDRPDEDPLVPIGSNICFVRLIPFMRNRFTRIKSQRDRRMRIAVGIIAVFSGLIGIVTAPDRVQNLSWQTYFLPVLMLALGCGYLFVAWRSRNWQFEE
jgi:hypothetical protein